MRHTQIGRPRSAKIVCLYYDHRKVKQVDDPSNYFLFETRLMGTYYLEGSQQELMYLLLDCKVTETRDFERTTVLSQRTYVLPVSDKLDICDESIGIRIAVEQHKDVLALMGPLPASDDVEVSNWKVCRELLTNALPETCLGAYHRA